MMKESGGESELRRPVLMGALAGLAATLPMTGAMLLLYRRLPAEERQPLPPRRIADAFVGRAHAEDDLTEGEETLVALAGHFGYGAVTGALYSLAYRRLRLPALVSGVSYGLAVWVASYLGWLPAAKVLPPATRDTPGRNFLMVFAHIVWGIFLDLTLGLFRRPRTAPARVPARPKA
jgi:uncharacterized membrane protein YagU involved in acid resistance